MNRIFRCNLKLNLSRWLREYWILHMMVIAYIIILSAAVLVRHFSFESSTWDLGIFSQACYSTLHGKLFYYTAELYANPGGCVFGVHFSPILFSFLPFYAVLPTPETLLITQTIILAVGAYPTFFLAKGVLNSEKLGLYFSLLYLLNPHIYSINMFDFHPDAFFVPFALLSLYFFVKQKWGWYFVFMLLSLFTKEFVSLIFAAFAVGELLWARKHVLTCLKDRKLGSKRILILVLTVIVALSWYLVATWLIRLSNPHPPSGFIEGTPWMILGENPLNPLNWVHIAKFNFLGAIKFDLQSKLFYLITMLAPLAFLPVFKVSRLFPALFWLLLAYFSNYPPYYNLGWHYSALFVPFLMLAAIEGFDRLSCTFKLEKNESLKIAKKLLLVGVLSALTFTFFILPITDLKFHLISEHDRKVEEVLSWIRQTSPNASILTQYDVFPHVSNMINSYVIPPPFAAFKREYYFKYANSLFDKEINYVIFDLNPDVTTHSHLITHMVAFQNINESGNYGLYASIDGVLVYKFGYKGDLEEYDPFTIHRSYDAEISKDTTLFSYVLPPGVYNITYRMKISPKVHAEVFTIEIRQKTNVIASMDVLGTDFIKGDVYYTFSLSITLLDPNKEVEFLITNPSIHTETRIDWMEISIINHLR